MTACNSNPSQLERMEAALEQAEAIYSEGENDTILFIPNLAEASLYFAENKQYNKAALAALYNGYAEKDYDNTVAMESFMAAEQYGELVQDSLTIGRAQYQIGKLLYYDGLVNNALLAFKSSEPFFGNSFEERALASNGVVTSYLLLRDYDQAHLFVDQTLKYAELAQSEEIKQKALNNLAILYQLEGDFGHAIAVLKSVESKNDGQRLLNHLNLGDVYMSLSNMDSAKCHFGFVEQALSKTKIKMETKIAAFKMLSRFSELQNDYESALKYRKEYEVCLDSLRDSREHKNIYRIQQKYDYEAMQNEMNRKIDNRRRIIAVVSVLLAIMSIAFTVSQTMLAKKTKQEAEVRKRFLFYVNRYFEALKKEGDTMRKVAIVMGHKEDKALLNDLRETVFGKKDPWDAIVEVFDTLHPGERKNLELKHPELSDLEKRDFLLSYFNVSRQDESMLLNIGIHSVDKLRQSVKKKIKSS